jgi:hypothetical protein
MFRKLSAGCLLVLILSPFTAPFSTCDLATFAGDSNAHRVPSSQATSIAADTAVSIVPSIVTRTVRVKLLALSDRHISCIGIDSPSVLKRPARSTDRIVTRSGLTTILRL